jgi:hypothetical protein
MGRRHRVLWRHLPRSSVHFRLVLKLGIPLIGIGRVWVGIFPLGRSRLIIDIALVTAAGDYWVEDFRRHDSQPTHAACIVAPVWPEVFHAVLPGRHEEILEPIVQWAA